MSEELKCTRCSSLEIKKNGSAYGVKRFVCKKCGVSFSNKPKKYPDSVKEKAIEMYLNNTGIRKTARFLNVSPPAVLKWIRSMSKILAKKLQQSAEKIETESSLPDVIEMDEIYTFVKKNLRDNQYGLLILDDKVVLLRSSLRTTA